MPDAWSNIALRFATYADLMVLFGLPLFALQAVGPRERAGWVARRYATLAAAAAGLGAGLAVLGLMVMAEQMAGAEELSDVTRHVLAMVLTRTDAGLSWAVRIAALGACIAAPVVVRRSPGLLFGVLSVAGAVALATLAWVGHGAMHEGLCGALHLATDVLHLLAAGAWVGALVGFVVLSWGTHARDAQSVAMLEGAASGFARIGVLMVAALFVSGIVNYLLVAGASWQPLFTTLYGELLAAKLAVIALMLGLAAANRYLFSPSLARASAAPDRSSAVRALRRSLAAEASLGFVVLALVAWLGVLSPQP